MGAVATVTSRERGQDGLMPTMEPGTWQAWGALSNINKPMILYCLCNVKRNATQWTFDINVHWTSYTQYRSCPLQLRSNPLLLAPRLVPSFWQIEIFCCWDVTLVGGSGDGWSGISWEPRQMTSSSNPRLWCYNPQNINVTCSCYSGQVFVSTKNTKNKTIILSPLKKTRLQAINFSR